MLSRGEVLEIIYRLRLSLPQRASVASHIRELNCLYRHFVISAVTQVVLVQEAVDRTAKNFIECECVVRHDQLVFNPLLIGPAVHVAVNDEEVLDAIQRAKSTFFQPSPATPEWPSP